MTTSIMNGETLLTKKPGVAQFEEGGARAAGQLTQLARLTQQSRVKSTAGSVPAAYGLPHTANSAAASCVGAIGSVAAARMGPPVT